MYKNHDMDSFTEKLEAHYSEENGSEYSSEVLLPLQDSVIDEAPAEESVVDAIQLYQPARQRGLRLGAFGILLEADAVYEIVEHARISPLPCVTSVFKGIINHRGNVVPVYELFEMTGIEAGTWERNRLLLLNDGRESVGLVVTELPYQIAPQITATPENLANIPDLFIEHTQQAYRESGVVWLLLRHDTFFSALRDSCVLNEVAVEKV